LAIAAGVLGLGAWGHRRLRTARSVPAAV